jgi:UDPglucose--hexose-1-phosphate uridylyltransferase
MEWRKCLVSNQWYLTGAQEIELATLKFDNCPFCPDGEYSHTKKIDEISDGSHRVLCIPNPQGSLRIEGDLKREGIGLFDKMNNTGADELVVETIDEHKTFAQFTESQLSLVFAMYARRIADLKNDPRFRHILAIKNQSDFTGELFQHPYSHILAFPMVPDRIDTELVESRKHYERKDRCLFCDIIAEEIRAGTRIVEENDHYVAFCPFASRFPYEVWLCPKSHSYSYESDMQNDKLLKLAAISSRILPRIEKLAAAYFFVLHDGPNEKSAIGKNNQWQTLAIDYHWHIEITPKFSFAIHFERSSGFWANPVPAEKAAEQLRTAL